MKIIEPSFEIINPVDRAAGVGMLRAVERYARISHRSEDTQTPETWERFIKAVVLDRGDWSVAEHVVATVIARVDRGVSHEWVRHRIGSYTQESTRFVNYNKREIEVIQPEGIEGTAVKLDLTWRDSIAIACAAYSNLLHHGIAPQIARSVLPNALATTIAVTYNLRSWRQFFMMRTTRETHPDFRRITIPMLEEFKRRIPLLYDDIVPEEKQSISLSRPR
jgi:thymidylate synthase (FAD)